MKNSWPSLVTFLATLCGCGQHDSHEQFTAVAVPTNDDVVAHAVERAKDSVDEFTTALGNPKPMQTDFSVKVPIEDGGTIHFMWLQEITFDGSQFTGVLGSDASEMIEHKPGESLAVSAAEISDWMYVESNKLVGGFTLRAIRDQLTGDQRKAFENSMWFEFE